MFHFFSLFSSYKCKQLEEIQVEYMKNDSTEYTNSHRRNTPRFWGQKKEKKYSEGEMQDDFKKIFAVKLKVTL